MATATEKDLEELKSQYASLKSDLAEMSKSLSTLTRDGVAEGRKQVSEVADQAREQASETWGVLEKEIEERPITSLAVALGIGFVIGKLIAR
jgi:ElaB/YqjD/DUF883 family membrane-anchored ribosome-binding protein